MQEVKIMSEKKVLILNQKQIQQKIERIAYQILEDNLEEKELVVAGILNRGFTVAQRLKKVLEKISSIKVTLMSIELDKDSHHLQATADVPLNEVENQAVILVDDVLNSGRTLVYGLGYFLNIPLKKIRTVILVDRSHRRFPVAPDYTGLQLATVSKEHVLVVLDSPGEEDAVYLT
jgi:pyrimidine operon attenuation protein/uracil phosphoribosyltransferase